MMEMPCSGITSSDKGSMKEFSNAGGGFSLIRVYTAFGSNGGSEKVRGSSTFGAAVVGGLFTVILLLSKGFTGC